MQDLYDRQDIIDLNKKDFNVFANFCLPDIVVNAFPQFYEEVFYYIIQQLLELGDVRRVMRFALSLPRGHAKTTFVKIFIAYGIIHGLFSFVLIVCANENRAQDLLEDVDAILSSRNTATVYDSWAVQKTEDNKTTKRGTFLGRSIILEAVGAWVSSRGLNKNNMRPDLILLDDAQTADNADSDVDSGKLLKQIVGTILKTRHPKRCGIIWIGNMYEPPENCLLYQFSNSPQWISLVTGGILADKTALWPELHSLESLLEEYEHDASVGQGHIWFAEIQNDPTMAPNRLLPDGDFPLTIPNADMEKIGAFITIDPAGNDKKSDDTAIVGHIIYEGGKIEIAKLEASVLDPEKTIELTLQMALDIDAIAIFPESNAYQSTLAFWMEKYITAAYLYHLQVIPVPSSASKLSRIRGWVKNLVTGSCFVTDRAIKAKILFQALAFKIEKTNNTDDILDGCSMQEMVRARFLSTCLYNLNNDPRNVIPQVSTHRVIAGAHPLADMQSNRFTT